MLAYRYSFTVCWLQAEIEAEKKKKDDKKTFSAKEKRKRDLGQQAKDKNYVEEEKRILREAGGNWLNEDSRSVSASWTHLTFTVTAAMVKCSNKCLQ